MALRSPYLLSVLAELHRRSLQTKWRIFHEAFRLFETKVFLRFLKFYVFRGEKKDFFVRNSASIPGDFNLWASDLDLGIILDTEENSGDWDLFRIARARRWAPFIGEVEIYTKREIKLRSEIPPQAAELLKFLKQIRKIAYLERALASESINYHIQKRTHAIGRILKEWFSGKEIDVLRSGNLARYLPRLSSRFLEQVAAAAPALPVSSAYFEAPSQIWLGYFQAKFRIFDPSTKSDSEDVVELDRQFLSTLLKLIPLNAEELRNIGAEPHTFASPLKDWLCLDEWILMQSVMRINPENRWKDILWSCQLEDQMRTAFKQSLDQAKNKTPAPPMEPTRSHLAGEIP